MDDWCDVVVRHLDDWRDVVVRHLDDWCDVVVRHSDDWCDVVVRQKRTDEKTFLCDTIEAWIISMKVHNTSLTHPSLHQC